MYSMFSVHKNSAFPCLNSGPLSCPIPNFACYSKQQWNDHFRWCYWNNLTYSLVQLESSSTWSPMKTTLLKIDRCKSSLSLSDKMSVLTSTPPPKWHESDNCNEHIDVESTEIKNGKSIMALRRMLGSIEYSTSQTTWAPCTCTI